MFRDGRDGYCSSLENEGLREAFYHKHKDPVEVYAKVWSRRVKQRLRCGVDTKILDIHYEDLTSDFETVVRRIMDFLGEDLDLRQLDHAHYSRTKMSAMKGLERLNEEVTNASVGRWKKELGKRDIDRFCRIAGNEMRMLGYL